MFFLQYRPELSGHKHIYIYFILSSEIYVCKMNKNCIFITELMLILLRNEFHFPHFSVVHGAMNRSGSRAK